MTDSRLDAAAAAIAAADSIVVAAGAGMGVDSGLPDFRGPEGFWEAYPPYRTLRVRFEQMASPAVFERDPLLAWGFYGHRRALYRRTRPHEGFFILRRWIAQRQDQGAVYTSNVDGQFQVAGFDDLPILECHGTIHRDQCVVSCGERPWPAESPVEVDLESMRAVGTLPSCPRCGALARPNVLMFGDWSWDGGLHEEQALAMNKFLEEFRDRPMVVIECGAGTSVPTVRHFSEALASRPNVQLVRINLREPAGPPGSVELQMGAMDALIALDRRLAASGVADG